MLALVSPLLGSSPLLIGTHLHPQETRIGIVRIHFSTTRDVAKRIASHVVVVS